VLSVNSSHAKRDEHIKKVEYLDAGKFSEMTFVSSKNILLCSYPANNNTGGIVKRYAQNQDRN